MGTYWRQQTLVLPPFPRGFHLITPRVLAALPEITQVARGLLHVFIQHTSASITVNENADPDVRDDLETALNSIATSGQPFRHVLEGSDDMPAHVKSSLLGSSLTIPVGEGRLLLGVWQGIYLGEHRNHGGSRRLVLSLFGETHARKADEP